jgi:Fungal specific transcription factor domain
VSWGHDFGPNFLLIPVASDSIYHFCEGHDATQHAAFGETVHIAVSLRMHEEASYEGLDPIECEIRRRMFWIIFGGTTVLAQLVCRY